MNEIIAKSELFEGLEEKDVERIMATAGRKNLRSGEYLFLLGDHADCLYVVLEGKVQVCFPLSAEGTTRDITVETREPGGVLGWSAFVKPYRFTLSSRAAEPSELATFARSTLTALFDEHPRLGYVFTRRLSELIGRRLLTRQALWARELQRSLTGNWTVTPANPTG